MRNSPGMPPSRPVSYQGNRSKNTMPEINRTLQNEPHNQSVQNIAAKPVAENNAMGKQSSRYHEMKKNTAQLSSKLNTRTNNTMTPNNQHRPAKKYFQPMTVKNSVNEKFMMALDPNKPAGVSSNLMSNQTHSKRNISQFGTLNAMPYKPSTSFMALRGAGSNILL